MCAVSWARRCTSDGYKRSKGRHADERHGCRMISNPSRHREGVRSGDRLSCCSARMLRITTERHAAMVRPALRACGTVTGRYAEAHQSYTTPGDKATPVSTQEAMSTY